MTLTSGIGTSRDDGRDGAVAALFDAQYTRMLRVATVLVGDPATAEDVVQEAFLALWDGWPRIRSEPVGYLHRSVVNGSRSRLRRRAVAIRLRPGPPPDAASAEDAVLAASVPRPLLAAMAALPRREREAVLLRHYLDLSEAQTAEALGIRPGSVKGYASRGLAKLRAHLEER